MEKKIWSTPMAKELEVLRTLWTKVDPENPYEPGLS
jgi:hypothetical protein